MKTIVISILFLVLVSSATYAQLTQGDFDKIRSIVKESEDRLRTELKDDISSLRAELRGDIESNSDRISELRSDMRNLTAVILGGFIALVIAIISQTFIIGRGTKTPSEERIKALEKEMNEIRMAIKQS